MANVKFSKDCIEYKFYADLWSYWQKYGMTESDIDYSREYFKEGKLLIEKYRGTYIEQLAQRWVIGLMDWLAYRTPMMGEQKEGENNVAE